MKNIIALIVITVCSSTYADSSSCPGMTSSSYSVKKDFEKLVQLNEEVLTLREKVQAFLRNVKSNSPERDLLLTQEQALSLFQGTRSYLRLRSKLWSLVSKYSCYESRISGEGYFGNLFKNRSSLDRFKTLIGLSAAYSLYEGYFSIVQLIESNDEIRNLLNNGSNIDGIPEDIVNEISKNARNWGNRSKMANLTKSLDEYSKSSHKTADKLQNYLIESIKSSPIFSLFMKNMIARAFEFSSIRVNGIKNRVSDNKDQTINSITNEMSKLFGNSVGMIESRKGLLFNKPFITKDIRQELKPLDILLEKTPFRLTDKFIPGHWGHAAVYIGNLEELKNEGLLEKIMSTKTWKSISSSRQKRILKSLSQDHVVLEALRPGVELNSLEHFMNIDDFSAIRPSYLKGDKEKQAQFLADALYHFGKDYDFNFDVSTPDKIVCSELVYWTYQDINWVTVGSLGRQTISPDNIIDKVISGNRFQTFLLYHDGRRVEPSRENNYLREICSLSRSSDLSLVRSKYTTGELCDLESELK